VKIGDGAVVDRPAPLLDEVAVDNPEVVVGDVGEGGAAFDVAQRPVVGQVGPEAVVHPDETSLVGFDAGLLQSEVVRVGAPPGCDEQV